MPQGRPASKDRPQLGERIAQARVQSGLTQAQLATKLGTTQRVITYWEREAVSLRADQLAGLAEALDVSADFFLGREGPKRNGGPAGKLRQVFTRASQLPREQQKHVLRVVQDALTAYEARKAS